MTEAATTACGADGRPAPAPTAAARAACEALRTGGFPDPVEIALPGRTTSRLRAGDAASAGEGFARAGVVKDAGDDPDVTHGALVIATLRPAAPGAGLVFRAGEGVGTVTRPGLPLPPGEPAINPGPRAMMRANLAPRAPTLEVEIAIPGGAKIAERTLNARLGMIGGLSILGTTGIVIPFSCSAWIHSIHRGIDVARAEGLTHIAGATGSTSEAAVQRLHGLPETALIDMGDFVGGMLKYLRAHPVEDVTVAGGVAKMSKLGQGLLDLHSRRGEVDLGWLARARARRAALGEAIAGANTAKHAFDLAAAAGFDLADAGRRGRLGDGGAARSARARERLEIAVFDRDGALLATTGLRALHVSPR